MQEHRVVDHPGHVTTKARRQSITFFAHPNDDCLIECLDGSQKYPTFTAQQHFTFQGNR